MKLLLKKTSSCVSQDVYRIRTWKSKSLFHQSYIIARSLLAKCHYVLITPLKQYWTYLCINPTVAIVPLMSTTKDSSSNKFSSDGSRRYQASTLPQVAPPHTKACSSGNSKQTLSLISFIRKYGSFLPIRVCVVDGYSGRDDRYSFM